MTERAKRAANELSRRGWQVYVYDGDISDIGKECQVCGCLVTRDSRYCKACGAKFSGISEDTLTDLEAAIVAALDEGEK